MIKALFYNLYQACCLCQSLSKVKNITDKLHDVKLQSGSKDDRHYIMG
jgi:hypothetical protein